MYRYDSEAQAQGFNQEDFREAYKQTGTRPWLTGFGREENRDQIYQAARNNRNNRLVEGQYNQAELGLVTGDPNALAQMRDVNSRADTLGMEQFGPQSARANQGPQDTRQAQANQLLNSAAGIGGGLDTTNYMNSVNSLVDNQARQSSGSQMSADPMQDMNLRNEGMDPGLAQQLGLSTQLAMQNSKFESDLGYQNALRARPISRDISHQQNDANLAGIRENNRASMANSLLNTMAQQGNTWANFYKMG